MHDQIYANEIIQFAETHGRVKSVSVEVGDLAELSAEALEHAIKNLRPGWRVKIVKKEAKVKCGKCGHEGRPTILERGHESVIFECQVCSDIPEVIDGNEIILKSIEVEDE